MTITKWLDTLINEKNIDLEKTFELFSKDGTWNLMPYGCVIEAIKSAAKHEQAAIKNTLVKIDFLNGDICHYFRHLAQALVN